MSRLRWAVVTGEYPPQLGGVSDYTRLIARALADAGDEVHVFAPGCPGATPLDQGVKVHRLPGHYGPRALAALGAALDRIPRPRRLLVQYVPHAFGWKAMNVPFCLWLLARRRDAIWTIFHEVAFPLDRGQSLAHNLLGIVTRLMASLVGRSAERVFVTIPAWAETLGRLAVRRPAEWLPVPSNVPSEADASAVARVRASIVTNPGACVLGHFGAHDPPVAALLAKILPRVLSTDERRIGLLIGQGGRKLVADLVREHPGLAPRLRATGVLADVEVPLYLAACDVLVQPYPDGVSSRRTSIMAGLAIGHSIVTNDGPLTEPLWRETGALVLAPDATQSNFVAAVETLLASPETSARLRARAAELYSDRFAIHRTIETLRVTT